MIYKVIGLMSGSSLDGLDIAYMTISFSGKKWEYEVEFAETIPYTSEWQSSLRNAATSSVPDFLNLHTAYGRYLGQLVNSFIEKNELFHKVHFISSHGHTAYHNPTAQTSFQLGDGASLAATTGITTISDLRNIDVAFGGQGAPIVPIADTLLFEDYKYCLNIGGITNISIKQDDDIKAFDIAPANQVLNHFAAILGHAFDFNGEWAAEGIADADVISALQNLPYFHQAGAKSLSNDFSTENIIPLLATLDTKDALATMCHFLALEIRRAIELNAPQPHSPTQLLVTGGGAHNQYLIQSIQNAIQPLNVTVVVPEAIIVDFKEAIAMAFIGILRWREEENTFSSVTGATKNSIGGSMWLAQ